MITEKLLVQAIETFGEVSQRDMAIEECAELIKALCKLNRYLLDETVAAVLEETVDVSLAVEQMRLMFDHDGQFEAIRERKLSRLAQRIAAGNMNAPLAPLGIKHGHYWPDGRTFQHSHKRGDVGHGHHGAKYVCTLVASD